MTEARLDDEAHAQPASAVHSGIPPQAEASVAAESAADAASAFASKRQSLGMSRADVAGQLKFAARQIQALEEGRLEELPAGTFARGMVRSYARLLKIDPAPLLVHLGRTSGSVTAAPEHAVSLRTPVPFSDSGRRVNLVYAALSLAVLVAVGLLAFDWYRDHNAPASAPELAPVAVTPAKPLVDEAAMTAPTVSPLPPPEAGAPPPADATPPALSGAAKVADGKHRIVLKFDRESWVEVKNRRGVTLLSQLNPSGSEKVVEGEPPFSIVIGNAGGVRVTYNEQAVDLRPHYKVDVARFTLD